MTGRSKIYFIKWSKWWLFTSKDLFIPCMTLFRTSENIAAVMVLQAYYILLFISSFVINVILITYKCLKVNGNFCFEHLIKWILSRNKST